MEVVQGLSDGDCKEIRSLFESIPYIDTTREDFVAGGELWRSLRRRGVTVPSSDCLIADQCQRRRLTLFSLDTHFDAIEELKRLR